MMKNPVLFSNKKDQTIFIYQKYDNSYFQLSQLNKGETTILNIPNDSYILVKRGCPIKDIIFPYETILETKLNLNYFHF